MSTKKTHKGAIINHYSKNTGEIVDDLYKGVIDIGFIESEIYDKNIIKSFLKTDELIIISSDDSLVGNSYFIDQLLEKDWVLRDKKSGITEIFYNYLEDLKELINVHLELENALSIKSILTTYKDTISCLSLDSVKEELKRGSLHRVDIKNLDLKRNFYLIYHKNKFQNKLFKSFKHFIKNSASSS